jgi:hypothetical protein
MSVPEYKRGTSNKKFLDNFHSMRKELTLIMMRDFGVKPRKYNIELIENIYELTEDDKKVLELLSNKYGMADYLVKKYPDWIIEDWRQSILDDLKNIGREIELANNIYISKECPREEYAERRKHWTLAIGYCNSLKDTLNHLIDTIHKDVKLGAYENVFKKIKEEILLLKSLRKSDKKSLEKALL